MGWDYGDYEGVTTAEIHDRCPDWRLFRDGCPRGENAEDVGRRVERVIQRLRSPLGPLPKVTVRIRGTKGRRLTRKESGETCGELRGDSGTTEATHTPYWHTPGASARHAVGGRRAPARALCLRPTRSPGVASPPPRADSAPTGRRSVAALPDRPRRRPARPPDNAGGNGSPTAGSPARAYRR
jgi:hypothetical protein